MRRVVQDPELLDIAKRAADICNNFYFHVEWEELQHKFIAIRLGDGSSDGVLYDSRHDAVKHQTFENECYYVGFLNLGPAGVIVHELAVMLDFARKTAKVPGLRFTDPEDQFGGREILMTAAQYDARKDSVFQRITEVDFTAINEFRAQLGLI